MDENLGAVVTVTLIILALGESLSSPETIPAEKILIKKLLARYESQGKTGRPIVNVKDHMTVNFSLSLIQVLDIDEQNQVLKTNIWYQYVWKDILLTWNPIEHENITSVRVPSDNIWLPDILLYNFADDRLKEQRDALVVVEYTGDLLWMPQAILNSSCSFDTLYFPFDEQSCELKFGSWTYSGDQLNVEFLLGQDKMDLHDYMPSNEWDLISNTGSRNVKYYSCCPEPYPDLTFRLSFRRRVAFYTFILILPCGLLSLLTLVIFWVPPESPAKLQLGMNIFLAFFVLLLLLADYTPKAATSIPLIGSYFCLSMVMITMSTVLACIIANMFFRGVRVNRAPDWLRSCVFDGVAKVMCLGDMISEVQREYSHKKLWTSYVTTEPDEEDSEMACARVRLLENGIDSRSTINDIGLDDSSCEPSPRRRTPCRVPANPLSTEVSAIREIISRFDERKANEDIRKRNTEEWRIIACVVDRVFFTFYVLINILGIAAIMLKAKMA
ncbi:hypothetical protein SNE40_020225 [Patella caerulea]|uniref:Uncharacterized protein n=1 Tax=Patella caerulea TaxID=87958 RepID=A0AAN8G740_PATCE